MSTSLYSLINDSGLQIHVFLLKHSINESIPSLSNRHSCISGIFNHVPRGPMIGKGPNLIMSPWSQGTSLRCYQTVTLSKRPVGLPAAAITPACVHSLIWLALRLKAQNTSDPCCGATFKTFGFYSEDEAVSWSQEIINMIQQSDWWQQLKGGLTTTVAYVGLNIVAVLLDWNLPLHVKT